MIRPIGFFMRGSLLKLANYLQIATRHHDRSGINGPRPSSFKTRRPSTINKKAIAKRAQPESVMPTYFLRSHAVSGHAEMPENKANQPLVSGHGPRVMIRPKPPPPATMVHAQATKQPDVRPSFWPNVG